MLVDRFPVEAGQVMLFARAIGDANPIYWDPEHAATTEPQAVIAPPTFVQSVVQYDDEWMFRPRTGKPWIGSGRRPTGLSDDGGDERGGDERGNLLHAEQHFEYHRHVRAGDVLRVVEKPGRTWEKEGKRGGLLRFTESIIEYRDSADELVITARSVGVVTGRVVEG